MTDNRTQPTIEPSRGPDITPRNHVTSGPPLGRRIFSMRNIVSILLMLGILYLVYRELLGLDWREVWASVQGASLGLFALAFAVFYGTFFLRALRWKALLANIGYDDRAA